MPLFMISFPAASGSFTSADLSQLKDGMARVTGKVRMKYFFYCLLSDETYFTH